MVFGINFGQTLVTLVTSVGLVIFQFDFGNLKCGLKKMTAPDRCYCLNQASLTIRTWGRAGKLPVGERPIGLKQLLGW